MRFPMVAALVAALAAGPAAESHAAAGIPGLRLVASDASGITLEYRLPGYERDTLQTPAGPRTRLHVPGFAATVDEGKPELPVGGVWVALPATAGASVEILDQETESVSGLDLVPVYRSLMAEDPKLGPVPARDYFVDEPAFAADDPYPAQLADLGEASWMRFQRVAALQLHPLRYRAASRTLLVTRRLVVRVRFGSLLNRGRTALARAGLEPGPTDDRQFEAVYRGAVVNYEQGRDWRARPARASGLERQGVGPRPAAGFGSLGLGTGNPEWKVRVDTTGVWRVTYQQLAAKGWPSGIAVDLVTAFRRDTTVALEPAPWTAVEIPIDVIDANGNTVFDAGDFVVLPVRNWADRVQPTWYERRYGDAEMVWLSYKTGANGLRVGSRPGFLGAQSPATPASFPSFRHYERNFIYFSYPIDVTTTDQFYWTDPNNDDQPIDTLFADLLDLDPAGPDIAVRAQWNGMRVGWHYVSGTWVSGSGGTRTLWTDANFLDRNPVILNASVPVAQATTGLNHLRIQGHGSSPGQSSGSAFNWMEITYPRLFKARNNRLDFTSGAAVDTVQFVIDGFTGGAKPAIYAYDVTDWGAPDRLTVDPAQVETSGGGWRVRLESVVQAGTPRHFVVVADVVPLPDAAVTAEVASSLYLTPPNGADCVMIAYDGFEPALQSLAALRRDRGIGTLVARAQDVYDEFNGGRKSHFAIRRFLRYALAHWDTRFVLLVGDASEDGQGWMGTSDVDYLPAPLIPGPVGPGNGLGLEVVPSDNWYGFGLTGASTPGTDLIPDLVIGRWTAGSLAETQGLVDKEMLYETGPQDEAWRSRAVLIADDDFSSATTFGGPAPTCPSGICYCFRSSEQVFKTINQKLEDLIKVEAGFRDFDVRRFYLGDFLAGIQPYPETSCPEGIGRNFFVVDGYVDDKVSPSLFSLLSEGAGFVNFQGHGNRFQMTHEELYLSNDGVQDIDLIANWDKPWIFSGYACHLNNFASVVEGTAFGDGLGERMVNVARKGGIASFASVGYELLPFNAGNQLNVHFYRAFFADPPYDAFAGQSGARVYVGEAALLGVARMVAATSGLERLAGRTYMLLGDPLTNVNFGPPRLYARALDDDSLVSGSAYYPSTLQDTVRIDVDMIDESAIASFTVTEQGEGAAPVPPSELTVTPTFPDSIGNRYRVTRRFVPRPASYDVIFAASDRSSLTGRFVLRFLLDVALAQGGQRIKEGDPALGDAAMTWRVRSPARLFVNDFQVLIDGAPVTFDAMADPADSTGRAWLVNFHPRLGQGTHRAELQVALARGGVIRAVQFVVSPDGLAVRNAYAFPNPFRELTTFNFSVTSNRSSDVLLRVFSVSGALVYERRDRDVAPGYYQWAWNGRDLTGQLVGYGAYIFRIASEQGGRFQNVVQGKIARAPERAP